MKSSSLFPYETIRPVQDKFLKNIELALKYSRNLVVHAPTGIGKSVAALAPALKKAKEGYTVFFLTSRHMQHLIAVDTLRDIKSSHNVKFSAVDIIGKQHMCAITGINKVKSGDFSEFCRKMREEKKCEFYTNTKKQNSLTVRARHLISKLENKKPLHSEELIKEVTNEEMCPYEIACALAKKSQVIISDYNYIFNPRIRESFFSKSAKDLEKAIVIIDEAHNLPERLRELLTKNLSLNLLKLALQEAEKNNYIETAKVLNYIKDLLKKYTTNMNIGSEMLVERELFINDIKKKYDYYSIIEEFEMVADSIRDKERGSFIGSVGHFLDAWDNQEAGFARILSIKEGKKEPNAVLSYKCLDPSLISKEVIDNAYSVIMMSGTLTPTEMYKDITGFDADTQCIELNSPFPKKNRLNLIIPKTTTKFTYRNNMQFENIAEVCAEIVNEVPGNSAIFFPSYSIRDSVYTYFRNKAYKTIFMEYKELTKDEKAELLERFKNSSKSGAVLLATTHGSFGEGVDLPGDYLKCVIVVGLPLSRPNLETQELIAYYDKKFGKGWDYGYVIPAFNKVLQSAGRCIRSETDKGIVVFLDERYIWPRYKKLFPSDWEMKISNNYSDEIKRFFKNNN